MTTLPPRVVTFNALSGLVLLKLFEQHPLPVDRIASDFCPIGAEALSGTPVDGVADLKILSTPSHGFRRSTIFDLFGRLE